MKQIIIARKDLNMSPGKLAAQVSHASMAFLTTMVRENAKKCLTVEMGYANHYITEIIENEPHRIKVDRPALYRREDLCEFAQQAFDKGEEFFYYRSVNPDNPYGKLELCDPEYTYKSTISIDPDIFEDWLNGIFTKVVCEAKNKTQLLKAKSIANELFMKESVDYSQRKSTKTVLAEHLHVSALGRYQMILQTRLAKSSNCTSED